MSENLRQLPAETTPRTRIAMMEFIKVYQGSKNAAEVAKTLGLKEASVAARASKYRNGELNEDGTWAIKPIALKKFERKGGAGVKIDADAANKLIAELGNSNVEAEVAKLQRAKMARIAKAEAKAATE